MFVYSPSDSPKIFIKKSFSVNECISRTIVNWILGNKSFHADYYSLKKGALAKLMRLICILYLLQMNCCEAFFMKCKKY